MIDTTDTGTRRCWEPWWLDTEMLVLSINECGADYEVDLEQCLTSAQMLDWIMQVSEKDWCTDTVVSALIRALRDILQPQAHLCSSGQSSTLTRHKVRQFVDRAASARCSVPPLLDAYGDDIHLNLWCPHCAEWHHHGRHANSTGCRAIDRYRRVGECTCPPGTGDGHRVAHCACRCSPYLGVGYILQEIPGPPPSSPFNPQRRAEKNERDRRYARDHPEESRERGRRWRARRQQKFSTTEQEGQI